MSAERLCGRKLPQQHRAHRGHMDRIASDPVDLVLAQAAIGEEGHERVLHGNAVVDVHPPRQPHRGQRLDRQEEPLELEVPDSRPCKHAGQDLAQALRVGHGVLHIGDVRAGFASALSDQGLLPLGQVPLAARAERIMEARAASG
eukprot:10563260-Alexandrium_andersonii.AAC.1